MQKQSPGGILKGIPKKIVLKNFVKFKRKYLRLSPRH